MHCTLSPPGRYEYEDNDAERFHLQLPFEVPRRPGVRATQRHVSEVRGCSGCAQEAGGQGDTAPCGRGEGRYDAAANQSTQPFVTRFPLGDLHLLTAVLPIALTPS